MMQKVKRRRRIRRGRRKTRTMISWTEIVMVRVVAMARRGVAVKMMVIVMAMQKKKNLKRVKLSQMTQSMHRLKAEYSFKGFQRYQD
jgi:hypothetical protein